MGTSLSCVQVFLGDQSGMDVRTELVEILRQRALEVPFTETTQDNDKDPDRIVFVGPAGDVPWITVYDIHRDLRELTKRVSEAITGTAVILDLIDSDVVHLRRYVNGKIIDDYCNDPDIYEDYIYDPDRLSDWHELDQEQRRKGIRGDLNKWRDRTVADGSLADLREAWDSKTIFSDDILWATVAALGMNDAEIAMGFPSESFTRLTFRLTKPRLYEIPAKDPPQFELAGYTNFNEVHVGDSLNFFIDGQNNGGSATGLDVVAWGSAIDSSVIRLSDVQVYNRTDELNRVEGVGFKPRKGKDNDSDMSVCVVSLPEFQLPQGISDASHAMIQSGVDWHKAYNALMDTQFSVNVRAEVETTGAGELFFSIVPHANPDGRTV
jgi:hypothetical protein